MVLVPVLVGVGVLLLGEVILFGLHHLSRHAGGRLRHLAVLLVAVRVGLGRSDWASTETRVEILGWLTTACLLACALVAYSIFDAFFLRRVDGSGEARVPALLRELGRGLVLFATLLAALSAINGVPLSAVVVSSTVLSAVLGLALQDVLKNLFAGISMQLESVPRVGDWLNLDGVVAKVVEMSWRTTRLRTNEGHFLIEPNSRLAELRLTNYGSGAAPVAFAFHVGLAYDTPPATAKAALLAAAASSPGALRDPVPVAMARTYGDSSITYELRVWTREVDALSWFRDGVLSRIWYEVRRAGLDIPFPIRTVHHHDVAGGKAEGERRERARIADLLGRLDLFRGVAPEILAELAAASRKLFFDDGERLVREGEAGDSLFVVDRGRVLVSKAAEDGGTTNVRLAVLESGSFFGEMSLLTGEPRSATITADGGCEVLLLTKADVEPLLAGDPALAETLSRALADRNAATQAAFAARRERRSVTSMIETDHGSILKKVREFFRLQG